MVVPFVLLLLLKLLVARRNNNNNNAVREKVMTTKMRKEHWTADSLQRDFAMEILLVRCDPWYLSPLLWIVRTIFSLLYLLVLMTMMMIVFYRCSRNHWTK